MRPAGAPAAEAGAPGGGTSARGLREAVAALRYRNFALFWSGALVSSCGTWMHNVTVPYVVYQETRSASLVGLAGFCQFFPAMVLGPVGGWLADHVPRRSVLLTTQGVLALLAVSLWALYAGGVRHPAALLAVVFAGGVVNGINVPSWQAFVPELVPREAMLNAITLNSAQFNAARALGPALAGVVLARLGPSWAFFANSVSYLAVIGALLLLHVEARPRTLRESRLLAGFGESVRYTRRHPGLAVIVLLVGTVSFVGNPLFQLMTVFADEVFHVGAGGYGVLAGALGAGGVLGAVLLGAFGNGRPRALIVRLGLAGYAAAVIGSGAAPSYAVGVATLAAAGAFLLVIVATLNTSLQLLVPEAMRGRVVALYVMTFTGSYPLGSLVQGALADVIGPRATVIGAGSVLAVVAVLSNVRPSMLQRLDDHPPNREQAPVDAVERRAG